MRTWWKLYEKEIKSISFFLLVMALLTTGWEIFLSYKAAQWPLGLAFGLSFIPLSIFPLILLWMGYNSYRKEWKDDTIYFLLSLPRAGWQLNLVKTAAGMTFYLVAPLYTLALIYFTQSDFVGRMLDQVPQAISQGWVFNSLWKMFLLYWFSGLIIYILAQFSQLVSQVYHRFKGLISIIVFILSTYVIYRGGSLLGPLFRWVPDLPVRVFNETYAGVREFTIYVGTGPLLASALLLIALFLTGSWLLERHLEV